MPIVRIFVIGVVLLLTACTHDLQLPRVESGRLLKYEPHGVVNELQLTKEQVTALTGWLKRNGQGWSIDFNSYAPDVLLFLKHEGEVESELYVYPEIVISASAKQLKRSFSEVETENLRVLLGLGHEN